MVAWGELAVVVDVLAAQEGAEPVLGVNDGQPLDLVGQQRCVGGLEGASVNDRHDVLPDRHRVTHRFVVGALVDVALGHHSLEPATVVRDGKPGVAEAADGLAHLAHCLRVFEHDG